ncbi:hypothetical protein AB0I69_21520 [Streptomyces sp. NPDC050508]|uniref:hypothetical protein n=1 Tax=Streptomyces sp. NPDC050508 TaxID=3155405 RepID=UPI003429D4E8
MALAALTVAHIFVSVFLVRHIEQYLDTLPSGTRAGWVFDEITSDGNGFVHGLVSRAVPRRPGGVVHRMSWADPSTWVACFFAVLAVLAVVPWQWEKSGPTWNGGMYMLAVAIALAVANWWAGSWWLIALSRLEAVRTEANKPPQGRITLAELVGMRNAAGSSRRYWEARRDQFQWLLQRYRRLAAYQVAIVEPGRRGWTNQNGALAQAITTTERAQLASLYLALQSRYPEAELPLTPWFVTDDDRGQRGRDFPIVHVIPKPSLRERFRITSVPLV